MNPKINEMWEIVGHLPRAVKLKRMMDNEWIGIDDFYERLLWLYRKYLRRKGYDPDNPPKIQPVREKDWQGPYDLYLGTSLCGIPIGITLEDLRRGGIIAVGKSGAGKTNLFAFLARQLVETNGSRKR